MTNRPKHTRELMSADDFDLTRAQYANILGPSGGLSRQGYAGIAIDADRNYHMLMKYLQSPGALTKVARGHARISVPYHSVVFPDVAFCTPLIRSKKLFLRSMLRELLWFMRGETDIAYLKRHNVSIWDGWVRKGTEVWADLTWSDRMRLVEKAGLLDEFKQRRFIAQNPDDLDAQSTWMDAKGIPSRTLVGGELGPVYGEQWRHVRDVKTVFTGNPDSEHEFQRLVALGYKQIGIADAGESGYDLVVMEKRIDQLATALNLLQSDPGSSRMVVSAWNAGQLSDMQLPPCHYTFQFVVGRHVRTAHVVPMQSEMALENAERIGFRNIVRDIKESVPYLHLNVVQRSCDIPLGIPFNWASYSTMLLMIGAVTGMATGALHYTMHDVHYYANQNQNGEFRTLETQYRALCKETSQLSLLEVHADVPRLKVVLPKAVSDAYAANPSLTYAQRLDLFLDHVYEMCDDDLFEVFQYNYVGAQPHIPFPVSI